MSSGLQGERTELAWLRTMLSSWASALIVMKVAFPVGVVAVIGPAAITVIACRRRGRLKDTGVPSALPAGSAALMACACAVVAIAALLM